MTKRLLLITGPKSLGDRPDAEAWAKAIVSDSVRSIEPGNVLLATQAESGRPGIVSWALLEASERKIKTVEIREDACRFENGVKTGDWCNALSLLSQEEFAKERVRVMVEYATKARTAGWDVRIVSVDVPWSETTEHAQLTLSASFQGLRIDEHMYQPPEDARADVVWIDTETGGTNKKLNPIIEIGAIHTDPSCRNIISVFETKLKPLSWMWVEPAAAAVNGYTDALWENAPSQKDGLARFLTWLPKRFTLAGYSVAFDRSFIAQACEHNQFATPGWGEQPIDPLYKVRSSLKKVGAIGSAKLDEVCEYLGIHNKIRHRALADAERARLVHLMLLGKRPESSLFDAGQALYDRHQEAERQSRSV